VLIYSLGVTWLNTSLRNGIILALLGLGVLVVYLPEWASAVQGQPEAQPSGRYNYIADLDFWQRTERERTIQALTRFDLGSDLNHVPLTVGDWRGVDAPETNREVMILLEPEQYVQRFYQNSAGHYLWLTMIGGRSSQPFHAPDICYEADGWQFNLGSKAIPLTDGGEVYGLWLEAEKLFPDDQEVTEHIVYYFYLFPDQQRKLADGIVLFKLTSPRYGSVAETLEIHGEFVRQLFSTAHNAV
jgi:hypothetical protein